MLWVVTEFCKVLVAVGVISGEVVEVAEEEDCTDREGYESGVAGVSGSGIMEVWVGWKGDGWHPANKQVNQNTSPENGEFLRYYLDGRKSQKGHTRCSHIVRG